MILRTQKSLEQVMFLRSFSEDFNSHKQRFLEAWLVLTEYHDIPQKMCEDEWTRVALALRDCGESVKFLFKIAQLVEAHVIDIRLLYVLYYEEVTGYLREKLTLLAKWCGTGLDLAANYDSYELARITTSLSKLLKELYIIHEEHGADLGVEGHKVIMASLEKRTKDLRGDPGRFSVGSDNYIENYVEITET